MGNKHRHCCHLGCTASAEFSVWDVSPGDPYAGTESCAAHVGPLVEMSGLPARVERIQP